jgi:NADH-ubiquinone oxidoreductase chain 1
MTEHSALPFAFFFLAEYGFILLMSTLTSILFLGGYLIPYWNPLSPLFESFALGVKATFIFFIFVWIRASYPRLRYDQLMGLCWCWLLPLSFAYFILVLSIIVAFDFTPFSPPADTFTGGVLLHAFTVIEIPDLRAVGLLRPTSHNN